MADPASTLEAVSLPPAEAIAFLRGKTNTTSQRWTDVWEEAHTRSFMVAGAATQAIVSDFRDAVAKALDQGTSLGEFRKEFDRIVETHGWEFNGTAGWRASIIYETNPSTAYSAGRYAQMTEPDTLRVYPYWQYMHTSSAHPRPQHLAWVGTTLRADDSWWSTHYPPNGWRCKCSVRPVSEAGLRRQGKRGPDTAPPLDMQPWRSSDGKIVTEVPHGIDPGFAYNPGQAWQEGLPPPASPRSPLSPAGSADPVRRPRVPPAEAVDGPPIPPVLPAQLDALPAEAARAIGAETLPVRLPPAVVSAIGADVAAAVPELLAKPQLVLQDGAARLRLISRVDGKLLIATVRREASGLTLKSVMPIVSAKLARLLKRLPIVAGGWAALVDEDDDTDD